MKAFFNQTRSNLVQQLFKSFFAHFRSIFFSQKRNWKDQRGVSLIEALIASAIFILTVSSIGIMGFSGLDLARVSSERLDAIHYAQEGMEAIRAISKEDFSQLVDGTYGITNASSGWVLAGAQDSRDDLVRRVSLSTVSPGKVQVVMSVYKNGSPEESDVHLIMQINDIYGVSWRQTTLADFTAGGTNSTAVLSSPDDGAVGLMSLGNMLALDEYLTSDLPGTVQINTIIEAGGNLFVASSVNGEELRVFDISNISRGLMPLRYSVNVGGDILAMAVQNEFMYVTSSDDTKELTVIRISDGSIVRVLNLPGTADARSLFATGTALYLGRNSSSESNVYKFDISYPIAELPLTNSKIINGDVVQFIMTNSGELITATTDIELLVLDAQSLSLGNSLDLPGTADPLSLSKHGSLLYVGRQSSADYEIVEVDIANPISGFNILSGAQLTGSAYAIDVDSGNHIYIASDTPGKDIVIYRPGLISEVGSYDLQNASAAHSVLAFGAYLYVGTNYANPELVVLKGGNNSWINPVISGFYDTPGNFDATVALFNGNYLYLGMKKSNNQELYIIDAVNPASPQLVGTFEVNDSVTAMQIAGNYIYLATESINKELLVLNVADPKAPLEVGWFDLLGKTSPTALCKSGSIIYLGTQANNTKNATELFAINVSTPSLPVLVGTLEIGADVNDCFIKNNFLLLATSNNTKELMVIDILNPTAMMELSSYNTPNNGDGLSVYYGGIGDGFLALGTEDNGSGSDYFQFTLAANGTPVLRSFMNLGANNKDVYINGNIVFVANSLSSGGLQILQSQDAFTSLLLTNVQLSSEAVSVVGTSQAVYLATTNNSQELTIVQPSAISTLNSFQGWFTSSAFDALSPIQSGNISWTSSGTGTVYTQFRTADTQSGLIQASWIGDGGVMGAYFNFSGQNIVLDPGRSGSRWLQYRAMLSGDSFTTPLLEDVEVTYN